MAKEKVIWLSILILGSTLGQPIYNPRFPCSKGHPPPCPPPSQPLLPCPLPCDPTPSSISPCPKSVPCEPYPGGGISGAMNSGDIQVKPSDPNIAVKIAHGQAAPGSLIVQPDQIRYPTPATILIRPGHIRLPPSAEILVKPPPVQPHTPGPIVVGPSPVQPQPSPPIWVQPQAVVPPAPSPILVRPAPVPVPRPPPMKIQPRPMQLPLPATLVVYPPRISVPSPPTIVFRTNPPAYFRTVGNPRAFIYRPSSCSSRESEEFTGGSSAEDNGASSSVGNSSVKGFSFGGY